MASKYILFGFGCVVGAYFGLGQGFNRGMNYVNKEIQNKSKLINTKFDELVSSERQKLFKQGSIVTKKAIVDIFETNDKFNWKLEKYLTLRSNILSYSKMDKNTTNNQSATKHIESFLVLDNVTIEKAKRKTRKKPQYRGTKKRPYCLTVVEHNNSKKETLYCFPTNEECKSWYNKLHSVIRGAPSPVELFSIEYPETWSKTDLTEYQLIDVKKGTTEYDVLDNMMRNTITNGHRKSYKFQNFKVTRIQRIQNPLLWKKYFLTKSQIAKEAGFHDERMLFHGTSKKIIDIVSKDGFDHRIASLNGMFGSGIYFAENSSKSYQYISGTTGGEYQMLVCRVALGNPYISLKALPGTRRPPEPSFSNAYTKYHSVIGDSKKFNTKASLINREFIVYDNTQCYPQYIIHFKVV